MAKFKRVNDQYTVGVEAYEATGSILYPGDVVSYNPASKEVVKLANLGDVNGALDEGFEVLLLAQSDAVTEKTGTDNIKNYSLGREISFEKHTSAEAAKLVVGYVVKDSTNIEF